MITAKQIETELAKFTGTTQYIRNFTGLLYTDGIKHLAETAGAYWLIDLVGSYQPELTDFPFQLWSIKVTVEMFDDRTATVTMQEDKGEPYKVKQQIGNTDFPLSEFEFYCIDNVMLLKSEY